MNILRKCLLIALLVFVPRLAAAPQNAWIATWASSPQPVAPGGKQPLLNLEDQTVRERVRVSIGGAQIRVRLSNEYGSTPLVIGSATVALPIDPSRVKPASIQALTFNGRSS